MAYKARRCNWCGWCRRPYRARLFYGRVTVLECRRCGRFIETRERTKDGKMRITRFGPAQLAAALATLQEETRAAEEARRQRKGRGEAGASTPRLSLLDEALRRLEAECAALRAQAGERA